MTINLTRHTGDYTQMVGYSNNLLLPEIEAGINTLTPDKNYVLHFDAVPRTLSFGPFWSLQPNLEIGRYFWEFQLKPEDGEYAISAGSGGAHEVLFGLGAPPGTRTLMHGNVWGGQYNVTGATNASPIVVTVDDPHEWTTGAKINITGVGGNTAANDVSGPRAITVVDDFKFSIDGTTGNGAYTSGGIAYYSQSYQADDNPAAGEWCLVGTAFDGTWLTIYYDGVPVGIVRFYGPRKTPGIIGGSSSLFIGGSNHQNFIGYMSQVRAWENQHPFWQNNSDGINVVPQPYLPETYFGNSLPAFPGDPKCDFLIDLSKPATHIADVIGGRVGKVIHFGSTPSAEDYPMPQFVLDPTSPIASTLVAPPAPAEIIDAVPSTPSGARVYDSFNRANRTLVFGQTGGLGDTDAGSAGIKTWLFGNPTGASGTGKFGILAGRACHLLPNSQYLAWVPSVGTADMEVQVKRGPLANLSGINTSIVFRLQDQNNFIVAYTSAMSPTAATLHVFKFVAGTATADILSAACPATNWLILRVVCSGNSLLFYCDNLSGGWTQVGATVTESSFNTAQGAGLWNQRLFCGLPMRWDDFLVK